MHNYESHRESKILFENNQNSKRWHSLKGSKFTPHRYTISPRPFTSFPSLVRATRPCHDHGRNNNNIPISIRAKKSKRKGENGWSRMILAPLDSTREIEKTWKRMMRWLVVQVKQNDFGTQDNSKDRDDPRRKPGDRYLDDLVVEETKVVNR